MRPSSSQPVFHNSSIFADSRLVTLWSEWLPMVGKASLDKWLKQYFRDAAGKKTGHRENIMLSPLSLSEQAGLTHAMYEASRFQQLACALEFGYQQHSRDGLLASIDWRKWDSQWHVNDLHKLSANALWYWVELRTTVPSDKPSRAHKYEGEPREPPKRNGSRLTGNNPSKANEKSGIRLRDAHARHEFFSILIGQHYFSDGDAAYLWSGLRPQWKPLLEHRKLRSNWTDVVYARFLQQQTLPPPLWLRMQSAGSLDAMCEKLSAQGVAAECSPEGIFARGGTSIMATTQYKSGEIEIQDLASQLIARSVNAVPGQKVWDTCAGAGGKTLAIATRMANRGAVIATDLHAYKLEELKRRAKRAGVFNVRTFPWNGEAPLRLPKEVAQQQGFDWVLVDAPCSSSGTWRRNPDARWRFGGEDTRELMELQRNILRNAAPAVRKNGKLVYATCSWQVSENEDQVDWFLQEHPQFALEFQRLLGAPELDSDTMFVAVLTYRPS